MKKARNHKKIIILIIVLFSCINLVGLKFKNFGRLTLALNRSKYYYGDLYEMSKLWRFKDKLYVNNSPYKNPALEDADIITMGDSFLETNFETMRLPHLIAGETDKKVFHVSRNDFLKYNDNPVEYLKKVNYKKTNEKKYLILETSERYALERSTTIAESIFGAKVPEKEAVSKDLTSKVKESIDQDNLKYLFYNNWLIAPFANLGKNFRFEVLKEINSGTPKYSKDPAMLFFIEDVNFNNLPISDDIINIYANNLKFIRDYLLKEYNLELIYVVMPTKYSIYGKYTEDYKPYNNFIPRAITAMKKYNINTFDSYSLYVKEEKNSKELLYYKGDSHFTKKGKDLILKEIIKFLK